MKREEKNGADLHMKKLKSKLDSLYSEFLDKGSSPPSKLFHYTDVSGLLGIFDNQRLWATHTLYLNDATEISYAYGLVEEIYRDLIDQSKLDINHPLRKYHDFLHRLSYNTMRPKPNPDVYVVCFCKEGDLLSQWRGYGNNGAGYAIGFDTKRLVNQNDAFEIRKAIYSVKKQKQILNEILQVVTDSLKELTGHPDYSNVDLLFENHAKIFENEVVKYAKFFKHEGFKAEEEWRLIYSPRKDDDSNQVKFRSGRFGLTPYQEIGLPDGEKLPVVSVRVGPTVQPELGIKALHMKADDIYPGFETFKSDVPLQ
ncbi:MAG: DUF2971 domain-containing protein [Methylobacter sp.]